MKPTCQYQNTARCSLERIAAIGSFASGFCGVSHAGCQIGDDGAIALADALKATSALDTLELPSCGIGAAGARSLARVVDESNFNLLQLNLRGAPNGTPCLLDT